VEALPAAVPQVARDFMLQSVAKAQVVIHTAEAHGLPSSVAAQLRAASYDSFINASHITTWVSAGVILLALVIVATALPTQVSHSHRAAEIASQGSAQPPAAME